jgi:hypothetical protein
MKNLKTNIGKLEAIPAFLDYYKLVRVVGTVPQYRQELYETIDRNFMSIVKYSTPVHLPVHLPVIRVALLAARHKNMPVFLWTIRRQLAGSALASIYWELANNKEYSQEFLHELLQCVPQEHRLSIAVLAKSMKEMPIADGEWIPEAYQMIQVCVKNGNYFLGAELCAWKYEQDEQLWAERGMSLTSMNFLEAPI